DWEEIFSKDICDKRLLWKIYKVLVKCDNKISNNHFKKWWVKDFNRQLSKEDRQLINKHIKRSSISYAIGKLQIQTTTYYYTSSTMTISGTLRTPNTSEDVEQKTLIHWWWQSKMAQPLWESVW
ncbi:LORF2 protein, partial [Crocuta crocuta]